MLIVDIGQNCDMTSFNIKIGNRILKFAIYFTSKNAFKTRVNAKKKLLREKKNFSTKKKYLHEKNFLQKKSNFSVKK